VLALLSGCLEKTTQTQNSSVAAPIAGTPSHGNGRLPPAHDGSQPSPAPTLPRVLPRTPATVTPVIQCGPLDYSSLGFDCNGRNLKFPSSLYDLKSVDWPHQILSDAELDDANEVLVCSKVGVAYCEGLCVNQVFNFRHRYAILSTGYIWPNAQCAFYLMGHNHESGLPRFEYFEGDYVSSGGSVVGQCKNTDLSRPNLSGFYSFNENRVPSGQISPAPDRSRLYYSLDFLTEDQQPGGRYILGNYQPMQESHTVYMFDRPFGPIYVNFQQLSGFSCMKREQVTPAVVELIR
jgi:hypothetical protein